MTQPAPQSDAETEVQSRIDEAASQAGLGAQRAEFGPATGGSIGWFVWLGVLSGFFAIFLLINGTLYALLPALVSVLLMVAAAYRIRVEGRSIRARLVGFERGLVLADAHNVRVVRYDQTSVLQQIVHNKVNSQHTHSTYSYTLHDVDGQVLKLEATTGQVPKGLPLPEQWGPMIQESVTAAQLPTALSAVAAGRRLEFGKYWITRDSIGAGDKQWPWSQVNEVRVNNGLVQLKAEGRWRSLTSETVARIPNWFIFLALAERHCRAR